MPTEVFRIDGEMIWLGTIILPNEHGIESEFRFRTADGIRTVIIDQLPSFDFLLKAANPSCLAIREHSLQERGWTENTRYEVRLNDDDEIDFVAIHSSSVRWGLVDTADQKP